MTKEETCICPLCRGTGRFYHRDKKRPYFQCEGCSLVFVSDDFILTPEEEKAEYDLHENNPDDQGYRMFLSRIFDPVKNQIAAPAKGLDFGCGPGPALAAMFQEQGYEMELYDPFYYPDKSVLQGSYDFITCTEVIEHIKDPLPVLKQLLSLLKSQGVLGIMTKLVIGPEAFSGWHYKNDPTHIRFYSKKTFDYLAEILNCRVNYIGKDVILFEKPGSADL